MMQFLTLCILTFCFFFGSSSQPLKNKKQPTCHEPPPKIPQLQHHGFLGAIVMTCHDFQRTLHPPKSAENPAICFDSRLYTNMKVQLFVAALIAGNFVFGPPRGIGRWKNQKKVGGSEKRDPSYVGITTNQSIMGIIIMRRVFFVAHVWCFFCEKRLSYCLECGFFLGGLWRRFSPGTDWRDKFQAFVGCATISTTSQTTIILSTCSF